MWCVVYGFCFFQLICKLFFFMYISATLFREKIRTEVNWRYICLPQESLLSTSCIEGYDVGRAEVNFGSRSPNFDSIPAKIGPANW